MYIYAYYDQGGGLEIDTFETKDEALKKIRKDLIKYWLLWTEECIQGEDVEEYADEIIETIDKKGDWEGMYGEDDIYEIKLKEV